MAKAVDELLGDNAVALCGPIVTELLRGVRNERKGHQLLSLLYGCTILDPPDELWVEAGHLGAFLGRKGMTAKTLDLLIAAHALSFDIALLTCDGDFSRFAKAGLPLRLM